jgi:membrane fusion protein (multidrug efflux system)
MSAIEKSDGDHAVAASPVASPAGHGESSPASPHSPVVPVAIAPTAVPRAAVSSGTSQRGRIIRGVIGIAVLASVFWFGIPWLKLVLNTVSTDDAYVNGHVTFVAPRVSGQVVKVLVDDNNRVRKGDLIVQLDKEPYQVQVNLKTAMVETANADLVAAHDQVRAQIAMARSSRFKLEHAIEEVNNQVALLRANVATWESRKATLERAQADLERGKGLSAKGNISRQELDKYEESFRVASADVKQALEQVYQVRVSLGLPAQPADGEDLTQVPDNLDQTFSTVRQVLGELLQNAAPLGILPLSYDALPKQVIEDFYKRDPQGNIDRIYEHLAKKAAVIQQAAAKLAQAQRDLDQANLNLRYCEVYAEIDGAVTRRNVNPGNNVQAGQGLMAIRSLTEIWIDANFKETQLADLRIGQRVRCEVDMYGSRREYAGRITGFTMGSGQTLALLPPQNATGNFVKIVQRLPVRIELSDYDPDKDPLFVGLSVEPYVYFKEPATGPDAGKFLQPNLFTGPPAANGPSTKSPSSTGNSPVAERSAAADKNGATP